MSCLSHIFYFSNGIALALLTLQFIKGKIVMNKITMYRNSLNFGWGLERLMSDCVTMLKYIEQQHLVPYNCMFGFFLTVHLYRPVIAYSKAKNFNSITVCSPI